jgi:hypothetical protein
VRWFLLLTLCIAPVALNAQTRTLDIYWIDVEGGAATLIVSPSGGGRRQGTLDQSVG